MANYGFLIDQRKCIGCHACSVACKSENQVPLGVSRTWVKYVETGAFPDTRRHFQVTRCNHCANPPCVRICPVTAMYQRHDGIVEFDKDRCIGCKACLQACPYDAIYIDPESHTAAKCHYCSHRTDIGLEPACVIVCPTHAIVSGDLDNPHSEISRLVAREPVSVRKPEQGTAPKLFYIDADEVTLTPTAPAMRPTFMWADVATDQAHAIVEDFDLFALTARVNGHSNGHSNGASAPVREPVAVGASVEARGGEAYGAYAGGGRTAPGGTPIRTPQTQGMGVGSGPITTGGRVAEGMIQTAYTAQHKIPWHWPVPTYVTTKDIGAGMGMVLAAAVILGLGTISSTLAAIALFVSLVFTGITTALLVYDLDKPARFGYIVRHPQWRSWLARGAFLLMGFSLVAGLWFLLEAGTAFGWIDAGLTSTLRPWFAWLTVPLALGAASYTAFLFAQAEGRDLWQSPLLPFHMSLQAVMAGTGALLVVGVFTGLSDAVATFLLWTFGVSVVLGLLVTLFGEFGVAHASEVAARAAHSISHGRFRGLFWWGGIVLGHVVPLALLALGMFVGSAWLLILGALAAFAAVVGLLLFEYAYITAPQEIPNS
ncbi:MAG TPA: 4Fe-4S dicluster domain-containing protein [Chloroflexia bacterium]|nr:4Fe-4S dicluster domain-containing protein [Chloroflexia bacterium]